MNKVIKSGKLWYDQNEQHVSAHGGGIVYHDDVFYWYGEDNTQGYLNSVGISCYSSTDLYNWKNEGTVLKQEDMPSELQAKNNGRVERPKVIYNEKTKKFVMWMHAEQKGYALSSAGVAISDSPVGPFEFLFYDRPVLFEAEEGFDSHTNEEELGNSFRDMTLFVDDIDSNGDGSLDAYVMYSSEGNWTLYIARLNSDYTWIDKPTTADRIRPQYTKDDLGVKWSRQFIRQMREAPTPFKHDNQYFMITSACTGWAPNQAEYAVASHPLEQFQTIGDPAVDDVKETTFDSQSTFVLPVDSSKGHYIYMGDRWEPDDLSTSTYVWLPLTVNQSNEVKIEWQDEWSIENYWKN